MKILKSSTTLFVLNPKFWLGFLISVSMFGALQRPPLFPFNITYAGYFLLFVTSFFYIFSVKQKRKFGFSNLDYLVICYTLIILLTSIIASIFYGMPATFLTNISSFTFLGMIVLYFIVRYFCYELKDILAILITFIVTTVTLCILGILNFYFFPGSMFLNYGDIINVSANSWNEGLRLASFFGNPNLFATYLILILPIVLIFLTTRLKHRNFLWLISTIIILICLLLSFSRSAILGAIVGIFVLVLKMRNPKLSLGLFFLTILSITVALFTMEKFLPNISIIIKERILSFLEIDTFNSRLNIWELAKNIYFQYPMGVGYGNFRVAGEGAQVPLALSYLAGRSGHNSFIVTLIENSPFALVTLILIAFHSIKGIFQKINPVLFLAISVSFLAFWIHASAHTVHALLHVWVLLACLENLRKIGSAELSKRTYRQQSRV